MNWDNHFTRYKKQYRYWVIKKIYSQVCMWAWVWGLNSFKNPYSTSEIVSWAILCPCIETDHDQAITSRFSQGSPYKENVAAYKCESVKAHRHLHGSTRRLGYTLYIQFVLNKH